MGSPFASVASTGTIGQLGALHENHLYPLTIVTRLVEEIKENAFNLCAILLRHFVTVISFCRGRGAATPAPRCPESGVRQRLDLRILGRCGRRGHGAHVHPMRRHVVFVVRVFVFVVIVVWRRRASMQTRGGRSGLHGLEDLRRNDRRARTRVDTEGEGIRV